MANRAHRDKTSGIPSWSWSIAAVGAILVGGSAGFMLYKALFGDASPPQIEIEVVDISPVIEGTLHSPDANAESSTITLAYVPSGSQIFAGLYFQQDPRKFDLQVRALGYEQP